MVPAVLLDLPQMLEPDRLILEIAKLPEDVQRLLLRLLGVAVAVHPVAVGVGVGTLDVTPVGIDHRPRPCVAA